MRPPCASDEQYDDASMSCIPLVCEGGGSPYFGRCLTEAEIAALFPPAPAPAVSPAPQPAPALVQASAAPSTAELLAVGAAVGCLILLAAYYLGGS